MPVVAETSCLSHRHSNGQYLLSWDRSTRSQSKNRRDLINAEINRLRDLLPFPTETRHRLSQLQLMACVCVYLRKTNYFFHALQAVYTTIPPLALDFGKALSCSILLCTQAGKLLFVGENTTDLFGQNFEELLCQGDNLYDMIDKLDHQTVRNKLNQLDPSRHNDTERIFVCRVNCARNFRRNGRFLEQKMMMVRGKYLYQSKTCAEDDRVFLGMCTPIVSAENRDIFLPASNNCFSLLHQLDMRIVGADASAKEHLNWPFEQLLGRSWYDLLHWEDVASARTCHKLLCLQRNARGQGQEQSRMMLVRMMSKAQEWLCCHVALQLRSGDKPYSGSSSATFVPVSSGHHVACSSTCGSSSACTWNRSIDSPAPSTGFLQEPLANVILATYQVVSPKEWQVLSKSSWLYQPACDTSEAACKDHTPANTLTNVQIPGQALPAAEIQWNKSCVVEQVESNHRHIAPKETLLPFPAVSSSSSPKQASGKRKLSVLPFPSGNFQNTPGKSLSKPSLAAMGMSGEDDLCKARHSTNGLSVRSEPVIIRTKQKQDASVADSAGHGSAKRLAHPSHQDTTSDSFWNITLNNNCVKREPGMWPESDILSNYPWEVSCTTPNGNAAIAWELAEPEADPEPEQESGAASGEEGGGEQHVPSLSTVGDRRNSWAKTAFADPLLHDFYAPHIQHLVNGTLIQHQYPEQQWTKKPRLAQPSPRRNRSSPPTVE